MLSCVRGCHFSTTAYFAYTRPQPASGDARSAPTQDRHEDEQQTIAEPFDQEAGGEGVTQGQIELGPAL